MKSGKSGSKKKPSNRGPKRGGRKGAASLDEALYGGYHDQAALLIQETYDRNHRLPPPDERDQGEDEEWREWLAFVGKMVCAAILDKMPSLFEDMARILKHERVNEEGDWTPVDAQRTKAAIIARRQREAPGSEHQLGSITLSKFARLIGPPRLHRTNIRRMADKMGVTIAPDKRGPKKRV